MLVNGISQNGKHIEINDDLSIYLKKPLIYVDEFTDDTLLMIFRPKDKLNNYKEGNFLIDDNLPINGKFSLKCIGTFAINKPLDDYDLSNTLKEMSSKAKNHSISLFSDEISSTNDGTFRRKYKVCLDTPTLKTGYYTIGILKKTIYVPMIVTVHCIYSGQVLFSEDDFDDNEKWLEALLCNIKPLNVEKQNINTIELLDLETITYSNSTFEVGTLVFNKSNDLNYVEKEKLPKEFEFIATSKNYKNSSLKYNDAPIGICIYKPLVSDEITKIWNLDKKNKEDNLIQNCKDNLIKTYGEYNKEITIHKSSDNYAILYAPTNSAQPDEPYWTSYGFMIFHNNLLYTGMIYFNCNKPKNTDIEKCVTDFLDNITINDAKSNNKSKEEKIKILGPFATKDGNIDAIKVNNMFFEDIIFNNPEEIVYKENKHSITGLQLNIKRMNDFPNIRDNYQSFVIEIQKVMETLENNKNLIINSNQYHKNFNEITKKEPITGIIYLLFAAWHMIKIIDNENNSYKVMIDQNLILGLPNGYSKIMEYIKTLRNYNELYEDFEVEFIGVMNIDSPIGLISNPVENGEQFKSTYKMNSKNINSNNKTDKIEKIKAPIDLNVLKYLHHEIPLIYKDIQNQYQIIEKNKQSLIKTKDVEELLDTLMTITNEDNIFNFKINMSYVSNRIGGTFVLERNLEQLKIDNPVRSIAEYIIPYDYSNKDTPSKFIDNLLKLYKSKNETEIRKDLIRLINNYLDNMSKITISKEQLMITSIIYDYDKEDLNFKKADFYKPLNLQNTEVEFVDNNKTYTEDKTISYDELLTFLKEGKETMKSDVDNFKKIVESKLKSIRVDEDSYNIEAIIQGVEPCADEYGNRFVQIVELMNKTAKEQIENCKNEEIIKEISKTIIDAIKYFNSITINWRFKREYPNYTYNIPPNIDQIKKYWIDKYDNLPSVKKEKDEKIKKAAENERKIKELKAQWQKECQDVKEKRQIELDKFIKDTRTKYDLKLEEIQNNIKVEIKKLKNDQDKLLKIIKNHEDKLSSLGIFCFIKKAELKSYIESNKQKIEDLNTKILEKEKKINSLTSSLEKKYEKEISDYEENLTNKYQLPQKPKELLNSKANPILTKTQIENNSIKEEILNVLKEYKRPLKISELQEYNNYLANISSQKISALLNELVSLNKIKKVVNMKKSYFTLKD